MKAILELDLDYANDPVAELVRILRDTAHAVQQRRAGFVEPWPLLAGAEVVGSLVVEDNAGRVGGVVPTPLPAEELVRRIQTRAGIGPTHNPQKGRK